MSALGTNESIVAPIPPTLSLDEAASHEWQAVIVGAGPAGAATAIRLARAGQRVLVVDRGTMPRGKVCGCCLSRAAVDELDRLGLSAAALGGVLLERVRLAAAGRIAAIGMPGGRVLSREALDAALVRAAIAAGAHWLPHADAVAMRECAADDAPRITVHVREAGADGCDRELRTDYAILAAGLVDHVRIVPHQAAAGQAPTPPPPRRRITAASRVGLGAILDADAMELPPGELVMAVGRHGYCGIVRLEDGRLDLAAAVDRPALAAARGAADVVRSILEEAFGDGAGLRPPAQLDTTTFRATPSLTHAATLVSGTTRRILRIGDAAGYVEPFTGEGIGWALATARLAAEALIGAGGEGMLGAQAAPAAAATYARAYRRAFRGPHARCRRVSLSLRLPRLVAVAVRAAGVAPWAARRLVPALTGSSPCRRSAR